MGDQKFFARREAPKGKDRVGVDAAFLKRLRALLGIVVPGLFTPETAYAATVAVAMVARTLCDLWVLRTSTAIETVIIGRDANAFFSLLSRFVLGSLPIAIVNNLLKYSLTELAIRFRERLTTHLFQQVRARGRAGDDTSDDVSVVRRRLRAMPPPRARLARSTCAASPTTKWRTSTAASPTPTSC